jgi:hypothetical protein
MKTYQLVNPFIMGSMNTTFQAKSSLAAAKDAFDNLSQYFGNHMPEFRMTLKRLSSNKKESTSLNKNAGKGTEL